MFCIYAKPFCKIYLAIISSQLISEKEGSVRFRTIPRSFPPSGENICKKNERKTNVLKRSLWFFPPSFIKEKTC